MPTLRAAAPAPWAIIFSAWADRRECREILSDRGSAPRRIASGRPGLSACSLASILRKPCCHTPALPLANNAKHLCQVFYFLWANLPASFHHEVFGLRARCDGLK